MPICPRGHDSQAEDWCDVCGFPMAQPSASSPSYGHPPNAGGGTAPTPPAHHRPDVTTGLTTCPICRTPQTGRYCEECGYDYDLAGPPRQQPPQPQPHGSFGQPQQSGYGFAQPPPSYAYGQPLTQNPGSDSFTTFTPSAPPGTGPGSTAGGIPGDTGSPPAQPYGNGFETDFRLTPPATPQRVEPPAPEPPARTTWVAVVGADREYFTEMMARSGPEGQGLYFPPYSPERRIPMTGRGQLRIGRRSHQRGTVPEIDLSVPPEDPGASHQHALLQEQPDGTWIVVDQDSTNGTTVNGAPDPIVPHTAVPLQDGDRIHVGAWTTITIHRG